MSYDLPPDLSEALSALLYYREEPALHQAFARKCAAFPAYPINPPDQLRRLIAEWLTATKQTDLLAPYSGQPLLEEFLEGLSSQSRLRIQPSLLSAFKRRCEHFQVSPSDQIRRLKASYIQATRKPH